MIGWLILYLLSGLILWVLVIWLFDAVLEHQVEAIKTAGVPRSSAWGPLQRRLVIDHPWCALCGISKEKVEGQGGRLVGHHILPFHERPDLELDPENIAIVCETDGRCCHFSICHFRDWRKVNRRLGQVIFHCRMAREGR